jgi:hypothetical protein
MINEEEKNHCRSGSGTVVLLRNPKKKASEFQPLPLLRRDNFETNQLIKCLTDNLAS